MAAAFRVLRAHVAQHPLDRPFRSDLLAPLFRAADDALFVRRRRPPHNNVCLFRLVVGRTQTSQPVSGDTRVVSMIKAVRELYGRLDRAAETRKRAIGAFRNEASFTPRMRALREQYRSGTRQCSRCGRPSRLVIDHKDPPFAFILDGFMASRPELHSLASIPLSRARTGHTLRDRALARAWHRWHDAHAVLDGLCARCNSAKGASGYRHVH